MVDAVPSHGSLFYGRSILSVHARSPVCQSLARDCTSQSPLPTHYSTMREKRINI